MARTSGPKPVQCYLCGHRFAVSVRAESTSCPGCNKPVIVGDKVVPDKRGGSVYGPAKELRTCGTLTIKRKGHVMAELVEAHGGIECEGQISAKRIVTGSLIKVGARAIVKGDVSAVLGVITEGAKVKGFWRVPDDPLGLMDMPEGDDASEQLQVAPEVVAPKARVQPGAHSGTKPAAQPAAQPARKPADMPATKPAPATVAEPAVASTIVPAAGATTEGPASSKATEKPKVDDPPTPTPTPKPKSAQPSATPGDLKEPGEAQDDSAKTPKSDPEAKPEATSDEAQVESSGLALPATNQPEEAAPESPSKSSKKKASKKKATKKKVTKKASTKKATKKASAKKAANKQPGTENPSPASADDTKSSGKSEEDKTKDARGETSEETSEKTPKETPTDTPAEAPKDAPEAKPAEPTRRVVKPAKPARPASNKPFLPPTADPNKVRKGRKKKR